MDETIYFVQKKKLATFFFNGDSYIFFQVEK